ncbi:DUF805 domain-containing protein [Acinetobacter pollinis]|uniref:DUF805 domain-containing protein n=1 Tax=Acinetobacter pollinis TaxID=2605270 RepID=UPI0018C1E04A|nr:DUF805 domain-containing protein [Acinetobacter pollinis]MBF7693926.1 DUF805 domain-containing protein [Acinetobacter pollinis]MBF7701567.1 DUF805 domain-containing protein [Acinetobacter pollinis]
MKGQILDFSIQTNIGIISGDDNNRYYFKGIEWKSTEIPNRGNKVDFDLDNEGNAIQIYLSLENKVNPLESFSKYLDKISNTNQAEENFNMIDWFVKSLKNYANFSGRARRKEYWYFVLGQLIISIITGLLDETIFNISTLILFIPGLAVLVRRLHDINKSGWWILISLIPFIGSIILLVWFLTNTKSEKNQWGLPSK